MASAMESPCDRNGMEALRLLGNAGLGAVKANGGGGIGRGLGVGDLAGDHDAALDGLGQNRLARLGMLIPAEGLARQEGVAEPLEGDEGVPAPLGLGQRGAQLFHAGVNVGWNHGFLAVLVFVEGWFGSRSEDASGARNRFAVVDALKVDAHFVFFRRPRLCRRIAALAAAVFAAQLDDGLVARRRQEMQGPRQAGVRLKTPVRSGLLR